MTMLSFYNDPAIKAKYQARVEAHRVADEIVQGTGYARNGKVRACAVGCTLDAYDHSRYPIELGLPEWLARLEDSIHEGVPLARAKLWPGQFLAAIPIGVDVEPVRDQLAILRMERLLPGLIANKAAYARKCEDAVRGMITFLQNRSDKKFSDNEMVSSAARAAKAAYSAARADSADSAAYSAARAASADSVAYSAAWEWEADTLLTLLTALQEPPCQT